MLAGERENKLLEIIFRENHHRALGGEAEAEKGFADWRLRLPDFGVGEAAPIAIRFALGYADFVRKFAAHRATRSVRTFGYAPSSSSGLTSNVPSARRSSFAPDVRRRTWRTAVRWDGDFVRSTIHFLGDGIEMLSDRRWIGRSPVAVTSTGGNSGIILRSDCASCVASDWSDSNADAGKEMPYSARGGSVPAGGWLRLARTRRRPKERGRWIRPRLRRGWGRVQEKLGELRRSARC